MGMETGIWGRGKIMKGHRELILFRAKVKAPILLQRSKETIKVNWDHTEGVAGGSGEAGWCSG